MLKINIRGLYFDNVTMAEAVSLAERALEDQRQISVFTPNAEIAHLAVRDSAFMRLLNGADILLPDGAGIVLASEILKAPLKQKVAGVDFGTEVLSLAAKNGYPVFLLGGKPSVAETAAKKLKAQFPALRIVGTHNGYFEKKGAENGRVLRQINESGARILFVCFGAPAQEQWIAENKSRLPTVRLLAGLGGSLDIYAGAARRAPSFFIGARLEWLYRLVREPRRFGRMLRIPQYITGAYKERLFSKK